VDVAVRSLGRNTVADQPVPGVAGRVDDRPADQPGRCRLGGVDLEETRKLTTVGDPTGQLRPRCTVDGRATHPGSAEQATVPASSCTSSERPGRWSVSTSRSSSQSGRPTSTAVLESIANAASPPALTRTIAEPDNSTLRA